MKTAARLMSWFRFQVVRMQERLDRRLIKTGLIKGLEENRAARTGVSVKGGDLEV
jgi:hypothetical protein